MRIRIDFTKKDVERLRLVDNAFDDNPCSEINIEGSEYIEHNFGSFKRQDQYIEINLSEEFMDDGINIVVKTIKAIKNVIDLLKPLFKDFVKKYTIPEKESKLTKLDEDMIDHGQTIKIILKEPVMSDIKIHYFMSQYGAANFIEEHGLAEENSSNLVSVIDIINGKNITDTILDFFKK